jgi:hypothetical protein
MVSPTVEIACLGARPVPSPACCENPVVGKTTTGLWRCPVCGQRFVTRNMPHSCEVIALDQFFATAKPELRSLFDQFVSAARASGPVIVNTTRSRVALQVRGRFAGIERPRKDHLAANFLLTTPIRSARLGRVEYVPPYYYVHRLRLAHPSDIDVELERWLAQAYQVGAQRHVTDANWPKLRRPPSWVHLPREVAEAITRGEDPSLMG